MTLRTDYIGVSLLATTVVLAGCDKSTSPNATQPVAFRLAAASTAAPASMGALTLTSFRLSIGDVALGSGDQFGCKDCQDNGPETPGAETPMTPVLVDVPLDGKAVDITTEQMQPGSYASVEIGITRPSSAVLAQNPNWPADATMEVAGTFNGTSFTLSLPITGSFVQQLAIPVVVGAGGSAATVQVSITLPVSSWFNSPTGPLNPADPAQRVTIEANARRSFSVGSEG